MSDKKLIKCYRSSGAKRFYYAILENGDSKLIVGQNKADFVLDTDKYEEIDAGTARALRAELRTANPKPKKQKVKLEGVSIDNVGLKYTNINMKQTASKVGFRLSPKAIDAYKSVCKSCNELEDSLVDLRSKFPNENYIDYNISAGRFVLSKKAGMKELESSLAATSLE